MANTLAQLEQHVALELGIHHVPDEFALPRRDGLEQQGNLSRMQSGQHALRRTQRAGIERGSQRLELQFFARQFAHLLFACASEA